MTMATNRDKAERLLRFYLRSAWKAAGLDWDSDRDAEVGFIIEALHGMVLDEIQEHAENAPHIYADGSTG